MCRRGLAGTGWCRPQDRPDRPWLPAVRQASGVIPSRVKADSFQGFQNGASSGVMPIGLRDWANA